MTINCNVTGNERKRLAQTLGEILLIEPIYMKAPTFAYVLSDYTIDKNGAISFPESAMPVKVYGANCVNELFRNLRITV